MLNNTIALKDLKAMFMNNIKGRVMLSDNDMPALNIIIHVIGITLGFFDV